MAQLSAWMGAGALAAGVSAALIAGADTASADTGSGVSRTGSAASSSDSGDQTGPQRSAGATGATGATGASGAEAANADRSARSDAVDRSGTSEKVEPRRAVEVDRAAEGKAEAKAGAKAEARAGTKADAKAEATAAAPRRPEVSTSPPAGAVAVATSAAQQEAAAVATQSDLVFTDSEQPPQQTDTPDETVVAQPVSTALDAPATTKAARPQSLPDALQSLVFDVIGVAVTFVAGPPVAAPGTNVTVRSSTLEIAAGRTVPADWYYPAGDEPPERLIYLQHGFLGVGAMYSYTASYLADNTNSIVVVPTLSSNRFVQDGFWLGDDQAYRATANLFLGNRDALTASAVAAGFADRYGPDAALPQKFMLFGHSLGAGVAAGAAGYYADEVAASGAANQLAGVVLLDGAPPADVLPDALVKLDRLGTYIPVLELGAPKSSRRVDAALIAQRPAYFNGVVLDGGKHLDAMQGGTPAIQFISYLYQGFPTEQNKSAAQTLIAGWANDIFAGRIDPSTGSCEGTNCAGIYGLPGQAFVIETPAGPASGVVIGRPVVPMLAEFQPAPVTSLASDTAARLLALRV